MGNQESSVGGPCFQGRSNSALHPVNVPSGYGKNGSSLGVDANLIYFPENEIAIVIFSNFGGGNYKQVIDEILE